MLFTWIKKAFVPAAMGMVFLPGCTSTKLLSSQELDKAAKERLAVFDQRREQAGLDRPLELARALSLAMDNNLDLRTAAMEKSLAGYNRKLATAAMLPTVTADAGYRWRSNYAASSSSNAVTGNQSLVPSYSSEPTGTTAALDMSWNVLDFGLAWMTARTEGDKQHMAEETRRRVAAQVALEVVYAWDRARAYQRVAPSIVTTRQDVLAALRDNERVLASGYGDPVNTYEYRSALLLMLKRMDAMALQMDQANDELARLLGLPAGKPLAVATDSALTLADLPQADIRSWQYVALRNRPEIRAALYGKRNAERGATRRLLQSFPTLLLRFGGNYDSNPYLVNNTWLDAGATLSFNIMRLATLPLSQRLGKLEQAQAEAQTDMLAAAVLSQVVIANKSNLSSQRQVCLGRALVDSSEKHLGAMQVRYQGRALDGLTMMRARVDHLLLSLENDMAQADARRARLLMAQSAGLGAWPEDMTESGADRVTRISHWLEQDLAKAARDELQAAEQAMREEGAAPEAGSAPVAAAGSAVAKPVKREVERPTLAGDDYGVTESFPSGGLSAWAAADGAKAAPATRSGPAEPATVTAGPSGQSGLAPAVAAGDGASSGQVAAAASPVSNPILDLMTLSEDEKALCPAER